MKILVISDTHGNITNLNHALGFANKIKVGAIIHCGDWNNLLTIKTVLNSGIPLHSVLGNADIDPQLAKKFNDRFLEIEIEGKKIGIIHNVRQLGSQTIRQLDILFMGHRHNQEETTINGVKTVNPGSLENDISFAIYDTETNNVDLMKI